MLVISRLRTDLPAPVVGSLVRARECAAIGGIFKHKNFLIIHSPEPVLCKWGSTAWNADTVKAIVDNLHTGEKRLSSLKSYFLQFIPVVYYSRILTAE